MNKIEKVIGLSLLSIFINWSCGAVNVKDFGAQGDGIHDDTKAIMLAIQQADDGVVQFPRGNYRITESIEIILSESGRVGLTGVGGTASIIMEGPGAAIRIIGSHKGSASPETVTNETWQNERMPVISELEIIGNHPDADGIEMAYTLKSVIRSVLIRNVRYGIHLTSRNRNVLIESSFIYNCKNIGIYMDAVNIHQININNCHISYNKEAGIKVKDSEIRNFQVTGNDIEYNCGEEFEISADIWIDTSKKGSSVREGSVTGNTIQAIPSPGGSNIRFTGSRENMNKIGLWSITGNHISNQTVNIQMENVRGICVTGNTFVRGYDRHVIAENVQNIIIGSNAFDHNDDYFPQSVEAKGGILMKKTQNVILSDNIIQGAEHAGAIELYDGQGISVSNCQVTDYLNQGISINKCSHVNINGCLISAVKKGRDPLVPAGIYLTGECQYVSIQNNIFDVYRKNGIVNNTKNKISKKLNTFIYNDFK